MTFQTAAAGDQEMDEAERSRRKIGRMAKIKPVASTVSMTQAVYIQIAGGLNFAALKKPSASGTKNLA